MTLIERNMFIQFLTEELSQQKEEMESIRNKRGR